MGITIDSDHLSHYHCTQEKSIRYLKKYTCRNKRENKTFELQATSALILLLEVITVFEKKI